MLNYKTIATHRIWVWLIRPFFIHCLVACDVTATNQTLVGVEKCTLCHHEDKRRLHCCQRAFLMLGYSERSILLHNSTYSCGFLLQFYRHSLLCNSKNSSSSVSSASVTTTGSDESGEFNDVSSRQSDLYVVCCWSRSCNLNKNSK